MNNNKGQKQDQIINGQHLQKAVIKRFARGFVKCGLLGTFDSLLKIISCVSMGIVMKMIQMRTLPQPIFYSQFDWILNISILFISLVIGTYCKTWFYHYAFELASKIRFSLISLIYTKVQEINVGVFSQDIKPGRIINICANDLNDLDYGLSWVFQLLLLPFNLFISTLIIYYYLGIYSLVGVITLIIFIGLQEYFTNKVSEPLQKKNRQTDLRINLAKQLITHIKILKMYAWDNIFQSEIVKTRKEELDLTRKVMESIGIARSISNGSVLLSAFFMCMLFHYFSDGTLTYEKVFSSLSILNVVKSSLGYFSSSRGWLANISILSDRVSQILLATKKPQVLNLYDDNCSQDQDEENEMFNFDFSSKQKINQNNQIATTTTIMNNNTQSQQTLQTDNDQLHTEQPFNIESDTNNEKEIQMQLMTGDTKISNSESQQNTNIQQDWKYDSNQEKQDKTQITQNQQQINDKSGKQLYNIGNKRLDRNQLYAIKEKRYQKSESEKDDLHSHNDSSSSSNDENKNGKKNKISTFIKLKDFDAYWNSEVVLENVNISLTNQFKFVQIIGKSGSGKSTLLLSILQEVSKYTGEIEISGKISYVPQEAIIYTGTIKYNILFGSEYDYIRYSTVKALCNLNEDIDKLPKKDETYLLEGGLNLSGGQRMRINLARALYSKSQILLLDDPLAALDAKVSEKIFKKMFKTKFLDGRLVLMSSHQLQYSQEADYILILEDGSISKQGTYNELQQIITELQYNEQKEREKNEVIMKQYQEYEQELQMNIYSTSGTSRENSIIKIDSSQSSDMEGNDEAVKGMSLDMMKSINVFEGYKNYIINMGGIAQLVFLISLYILTELSYILFSTFFGKLSKTESNETIFECGAFALSYLILELGKSIYFCKLNYHASEQLHSKMLDSVTKAPMSFFASTSIGNIINRFSNDVGVLDKTLPACLLDLIKGLISNLILIITVCIFNLPLVPFAIIIIVGLVFARKKFSQVISLSKQADLISRSPIFNQLSETMTNLTIIRVFHQQERFKLNFQRAIYDNTRAFYSMSKNQRMFDLVLELIITGMIVVGISYILISLFVFDVQGSSVTLSIYFLINLGQGFSYAVRQTLTADINMLSTLRIHEYTVIEHEEKQTQNLHDRPPLDNTILSNFPKTGQITFNNINLRYPNDIKLTLKKLSFNIPTGQKVGVVGRTGAGKSSLINALFRLYPIQHNPNVESSIKIDGINIEDIPLPILRNSISIIPQEPIIFQGSARFNLDPIGKYTEEQLLNVIREVGLSNKITDLQDDLQSLSVGEKQLICLARAFLKNSQILILDEVTANLDKTIDEFIQEKVRILFKDKTIIAIAHRLISISDYDKILVLENGYLKDFDHPFLMLVENENDTKITKKKNIFAGLVKNTGKETARKIMTKSREAYFLQKLKREQSLKQKNK